MGRPNDVKFAAVHPATGPRLRYAERGNPEGEAIVFLHAYADSWYWFSRALPLLSPGHHAPVPDQRGHGGSDKPECGYTVDDFAADVDAFVKALGLGEVTLVGHSSGGLIAQRVALDYPRRFGRLVLIGAPTTLVHNEAVAGAREEILALEDPVPIDFVRCFIEGTIHHPVPGGSALGWSRRVSRSRHASGATTGKGCCSRPTTRPAFVRSGRRR
jgi:non-heme chloroperoxidase